MGSEVQGFPLKAGYGPGRQSFASFTGVGWDFEATLWVSLLEKSKPKLA